LQLGNARAAYFNSERDIAAKTASPKIPKFVLSGHWSRAFAFKALHVLNAGYAPGAVLCNGELRPGKFLDLR
jgi:hypothetical protein